MSEPDGKPGEGDASDDPPAAPQAAGGARFRPPIRREAVEPPSRGLRSVEASRVERNRVKKPPFRVIAWFLLVTAVALAFYFRHAGGELDRERQRLLADQRAVESELGKVWYPLRDRIEAWTVELAAGEGGAPDLVDKAALAGFPFQELPGIYLRVASEQATDKEAVRKAAQGSLRDGFTTCLMRTPVQDPMAGAECQNASECRPGELCNEFFHCAEPGQPYNARLAYRALFVLTPEWIKDVQEVDNDLRLRALRGTFDLANRVEFPIAVNLFTRAKFFLLVVDERPLERGAAPDAGVSDADEDVIAGRSFPMRVGLWRLSDDKQLLRLRRHPEPSLRESPGAIVADPSARAATLRQAQSCELAQHVRCAVGDPGASCEGR